MMWAQAEPDDVTRDEPESDEDRLGPISSFDVEQAEKAELEVDVEGHQKVQPVTAPNAAALAACCRGALDGSVALDMADRRVVEGILHGCVEIMIDAGLGMECDLTRGRLHAGYQLLTQIRYDSLAAVASFTGRA